MNVQVIVHDAEEGGFWAEVPALPGCATQGETMEELLLNIQDAVAGCLAVSEQAYVGTDNARVLEVAV